MSLVVNDVDSHWVFSGNGSSAVSSKNMKETGWMHVNTTSTDSGTALWSATPNSSATLVFQGSGVYLYSYYSSTGGIMNVTLDYDSTLITLHANETQPVGPVYSSLGLDETTQHALMVSFVGGGGVLDAGINIGSVNVVPAEQTAFPPTLPTPLPPSFPDKEPTSVVVSSPAKTTTMTMTMMMTMTVTAVPSTGAPYEGGGNGSLSKGAVAGIAVGSTIAAVVIFIVVFALIRRRHGRGRPFSWPGSSTAIGQARREGSGLRGLWLGQRYSRGSSRGEPGFMMIRDREQDAVEYPFGNGRASVGNEDDDSIEKIGGEYLPKIKHASTLSAITLPRFADPEMLEALEDKDKIVYESPRNSSDIHSNNMTNVMHARNGSLAVSIRVDTNVASSMGHRRNLSRVGRTPPRQMQQRVVSTVSGAGDRASGTASYMVHDLGRQGNAYEVTRDERDGGGDGDGESAGEDDVEFYTTHSGFGSRSSRVFPFSPSRDEAGMSLEEIEERTYDRDELHDEETGEGDDVDDCMTPLLPESPAIPSTHASSLLSHGHALSTRGSRVRRQSTKSSRNALRSLRSFRVGSRSSITKKPSVRSLAASVTGIGTGTLAAAQGGTPSSTSMSGSVPTPSSPTPISAAPTSFRTSSSSHYSHSQSHRSSSSPATAASRAGTNDSASSDSPSVFRFPPPPRVFGGGGRNRASGGTVNSDAMVFPPPLPSAALTGMSSSSSEPTVRPDGMSPGSTPMQAEYPESISGVVTAETISQSVSAPQLEAGRTPAQQSANANAIARMRRTHRPAYGPRAYGSSVSSVSSFASANAGVSGAGPGSEGSSSDATYLMPQDRADAVGTRRHGLGEDDGRLSVVEESAGSSMRTASERPSVDDSAELNLDHGGGYGGDGASESMLPSEHGMR